MKIPRPHLSINHLKIIKEAVVAIGVPLLLVMAIHANVIAAKQAKQTNSIVSNQVKLLNSNSDLLTAINNAIADNHTTSDQKANLIICMLQVPVEDRTTDVLNKCRITAQATTSTTLPAKTSSPKASAQASPTTSQPQSATSPSSSSQSPPQSSPPASSTPVTVPKPGIVKQVLNFLGL